MKQLFLYIILFTIGTNTAISQSTYPKLTEFVTDYAQIMSVAEKDSLNQKLKAYESLHTHQIVVLTIETLNGDTIENYALQTFDINNIGQEDADNGILILFSEADRKVRIEVGNGFEPIITDAFASRIIRNTMIPEFKEERYFTGINNGVSELIHLIDDPQYREEFADQIKKEDQIPTGIKIFIGLFMTAFIGAFIFLGGRVFVSTYQALINTYKGLITGKVSLLYFPFLMVSISLGVVFSLPFIILPLIFGFFIVKLVLNNKEPNLDLENLFSTHDPVLYLIIGLLLLLVITPLIIAFFSRKEYQDIKFSLLKNDKKYLSKYISSSGSSWGSSSSFSSGGSSSSFSGGGGSSSGGGASGSW